MATGAFVSCTIDYTGSAATFVFGTPTASQWDAPVSEDGDPPVLIVNGLSIPSVTVSSVVGETLAIVVQLQGVVHLNDVVTTTVALGWHTDNGATDQTGSADGAATTNNSKQLQDED